jgi:DNA topoisomerase-1
MSATTASDSRGWSSDLTLLRVGTERYADEHDTYGASTLRCDHATTSGSRLTLCFTGKSGKEQCVEVDDAEIAEFVRHRHRDSTSGSEVLFSTASGWSVDADDVKVMLC